MSVFLKPEQAKAAPYGVARSLTAAATVVSGPQAASLHVRRMQGSAASSAFTSAGSSAVGWQSRAWQYYDDVGEVKFAFTMVANLLSRVRLFPAYVPDPSKTPVPLPTDTDGEGVTSEVAAATAAFSRLDMTLGGKPQLMRSSALNFLVAGEAYLVQRPATLLTKESWQIMSVDEIRVHPDGRTQVRNSGDKKNSSQWEVLPEKAYVARVWRSHPRYSYDADSSMLGLLDLCSELLLLSSTYRTTARSRLNAGALYLPDGLSITPQNDVAVSDYDEIDPSAVLAPVDPDMDDDFEMSLTEAMATPVDDETSVASLVPMVIRGPAELGEKIRMIKFERSFDPALTARADRVLDRIMQGIDVPKDIVQGLANVRYSNAVTIDENLYKAHIEPLALLICDALTTVLLRPVMRALGVSEAETEKFCIWYDPSLITTKPNRSEDADNGYEKNLLSGSAWRSAHGFTDDDAPSPTEVAVRMLIERGSMTPELTESMLTAVAPDMMQKVKDAVQANMPAPLDPGVAAALGQTELAGDGDIVPVQGEPEAEGVPEAEVVDESASGDDQGAEGEPPADTGVDEVIDPKRLF